MFSIISSIIFCTVSINSLVISLFDNFYISIYTSLYYLFNLMDVNLWFTITDYTYLYNIDINSIYNIDFNSTEVGLLDDNSNIQILDFIFFYNFIDTFSNFSIYIYNIYHYTNNLLIFIVLVDYLIIVYSLVLLLTIFLSFFIKEVFLKNLLMCFFFISNEIESNLISIIDFFFIMITFFFIFFFINFLPNFFTNFSSIIFFCIFLIINIISIISYISTFNINIFVFLSGLQFKLNLQKWFIFDTSNLIVFVLRILLQYIRLLLCSIFFLLLQELFDFFKNNAIYTNLYIIYGVVKNLMLNFLLRFLQVLIELLDTTTNISMQVTIFIVVVMWLMPFLFSNIKKKNKYIK